MDKSPMHAAPTIPITQLDAATLLSALIADGLISASTGQRIQSGLRNIANQHPVSAIAALQPEDARNAGRTLSIEALTQWFAARCGLPYVRIDPLHMNVTQVTSIMPYPYAARARILPIAVRPNEVVIAVADPFKRDWEADLARLISQPIRRVIANPEDIDRYLVEFYALARSVKSAETQSDKAGSGGVQNLEQLTQLGHSGKLTADDQHIVAIVDWLLQYAFEQRASDIHLEPRREFAQIRFRIDGVLHDVYQVPAGIYAAVSSRIKILARMDVAEKRRPQDGRIKTRTPGGKEIELRIASLPTAFGEKLVLRIFDPDVLVKDFAALGFSEHDAARWRELIKQPNGIILVTGPTGSGKTTTLYSTLKQLATSRVNVCTIEDPIELVEPAFNQIQVQPGIDLTFAAGVRALMRQDPDIIMVGEIRDLETAEVAVQAALTGHLVLATLHTNDAPSAITRLLDLGVASYLIKSTLLGVVAQRLVRTLCPHCKEAVAIDPAEWKLLTGGWSVKQPSRMFRAIGCLECRETGFLGRTGIYEMLTMTPAFRTLITDSADPARLRETAIRDGMLPLRLSGAQKIAQGLTTPDEVLKVAPPALLRSAT
ncbi:type II/IV secretion system protein [Sinimarinibacterium sp. CAU 1509]|uniref:GspE/PulE family protein n=1 Tax=Sinimarinibacterium sp. CAU 1509 TaxID=2562283 RepID=UPI0010ABF178|nr:GspE/PulE family protein [Sinimarinibacterium sp. CAU 1509]TJY59380.1 type II/IV secretion system protein [Sinimarinibacterium sp. CAU 1509]